MIKCKVCGHKLRRYGSGWCHSWEGRFTARPRPHKALPEGYKEYVGECGTCHTPWNLTLEIDYPRHDPGEAFDVECPLPWCGVVELKEKKDV